MKRRLVFPLACHSEADPVQRSHTGKKKKEKCTGSARCVRPPRRPRNVPESPKRQAHYDHFLENRCFFECGFGRLWEAYIRASDNQALVFHIRQNEVARRNYPSP